MSHTFQKNQKIEIFTTSTYGILASTIEISTQNDGIHELSHLTLKVS
jgi:hypothetical protein